MSVILFSVMIRRKGWVHMGIVKNSQSKVLPPFFSFSFFSFFASSKFREIIRYILCFVCSNDERVDIFFFFNLFLFHLNYSHNWIFWQINNNCFKKKNLTGFNHTAKITYTFLLPMFLQIKKKKKGLWMKVHVLSTCWKKQIKWLLMSMILFLFSFLLLASAKNQFFFLLLNF